MLLHAEKKRRSELRFFSSLDHNLDPTKRTTVRLVVKRRVD